MARSDYVVDVMGYSGTDPDKKTVFIRANSINDVHGLQETWDTGSILWDISAKKLYMLDKSGSWIEQ